LYLAQAKGYFRDEGINVAILEPNDPSDVTEIIGSGRVDMGFKAMIHTLAVGPPLHNRTGRLLILV
jgi:pyrimidine precursor biosynthesis enzyme